MFYPPSYLLHAVSRKHYGAILSFSNRLGATWKPAASQGVTARRTAQGMMLTCRISWWVLGGHRRRAAGRPAAPRAAPSAATSSSRARIGDAPPHLSRHDFETTKARRHEFEPQCGSPKLSKLKYTSRQWIDHDTSLRSQAVEYTIITVCSLFLSFTASPYGWRLLICCRRTQKKQNSSNKCWTSNKI